ncbi:MAG: hypothetical protein V2B20_25440 [Pseudomonadota bacterium]
MKIGCNRLMWYIFFILTVLIANTAFAQEGKRKYVYRDYNSEGTVYSQRSVCNIMPARAAEKSMVRVTAFNKPGFDGSGTNIRIEFSKLKEPPRWAGVVFPVEADYWGEEAEASSLSVLDLSKAKKLIFFAKGEKGGECIQVKAAIAGDRPYGDSALVPVMTDWITLGKEWKRYMVTVDGSQLKRVITPFAVITNLAYNPEGAITLDLDEIYYELGE